jgi:hypothetical protein
VAEKPSPVVPLSQKEVPLARLSPKEVPIAPLSQKEVPLVPLSPWLQLMLAEITRKREELEGARAEAARRVAELGTTHEHGGPENPPTY